MIALAQRVNGIRFDGLHSFYDFGMWLAERPDYGTPNPKIHITQVPGMDGALDLTEANSGEVKYTNRTIRFTFAKMVELDKQEEFKAIVLNALHGKYIQQIIPDEAPDWYYSGRVNVDFTNLASWKLRCIITVDAYPYALKREITKVNFDGGGEPSLQNVDMDFEDVSKQSWNSDLRLGTKSFPSGLDIPGSAIPQLIIRWPSNADTFGGLKKLSIYDADGHSYDATIQTPASVGEVRIPLESLITSGVNPSRVYRVLLSGIGGCSLHAEIVAQKFTIWNSRRSVCPTVVLVASSNVEFEIFVNGNVRTVSTEQTEFEDIILKHGWNEIIIPIYNGEATITEFYMEFREGRL